MLIYIVNGTDIWMVQRCGSFGLADKALFVFLGLGEMRWKKLQSYIPVEFDVAGTVDHTHTSFTQFLFNSIM